MSNTSIGPIDRILSAATTLGQSGTRSDSNAKVLPIFQEFWGTWSIILFFHSVLIRFLGSVQRG